MKVRCIINVHYVRDLINKNGNIVPATDIIESMLLEEFETIEVSEEQYQYMQAFCSDGELHSLDEMRDDLNVFYKQLSTPRLAYIEKMYKDYIMDSRPMECKQRIKAFVIPLLSDKFQMLYHNDFKYIVDRDVVYKYHYDGKECCSLLKQKHRILYVRC